MGSLVFLIGLQLVRIPSDYPFSSSGATTCPLPCTFYLYGGNWELSLVLFPTRAIDHSSNFDLESLRSSLDHLGLLMAHFTEACCVAMLNMSAYLVVFACWLVCSMLTKPYKPLYS